MPIAIWWAGSILVTSVGGWAAGFFGSDSLKHWVWFALIAVAVIAFFYVWQVTT